MKLTLIGRPGKTVEQDTIVLTTMESSQAPNLPPGLPAPPPEPTTYLVLIAKKQWRRVQESLENNPEDKLIIEGYPVFDKRAGQVGMLTVYAHNVTSIVTQRSQREASRPKGRR